MRAVKKKAGRRARAPLPLPDGTTVRRGREEEEGVPVLLWRVETPAVDAAYGKTDAASFYAETARRTGAYCAGRLSFLLREEYRRADPAHRRFTFRPALYEHTVKTVAEDGEITFLCTVRLSRAGRVLFFRVFSESWDRADGTLIRASESDAEEPKGESRKNEEKKREKG